MRKILEKVGIERTYLSIIKVIYEKSTANIILDREKFESMSLRSGMRQGHPLSLLSQYCTQSTSYSNQAREGSLGDMNRERSQTMPIQREDMILHIRDP